MSDLAFTHASTRYRARKLSSGTAPATGWHLETWVVTPSGEPGRPAAQLQLFRHEGAWRLWSGNIVLERTRNLGRRLAMARNRLERQTSATTA